MRRCTAHVRFWGNSGHWNAKLKYKFSGVPRETEFKLNLSFNLWRCDQRRPRRYDKPYRRKRLLITQLVERSSASCAATKQTTACEQNAGQASTSDGTGNGNSHTCRREFTARKSARAKIIFAITAFKNTKPAGE